MPDSSPVPTPIETLSGALDALDYPGIGAEALPLTQALGRVAACAVHAPRTVPPWPVARVDGFVGTDIVPGRPFRITARVFPGDPAPPLPEPGRVLRVTTGAPLPAGCPGVVPDEHTETGDDGSVRFTAVMFVPPTPAGQEGRAGDVLLGEGDRLWPEQIRRLAEFGVGNVTVREKPVVDLFAIGDELTATEPLPDSNAVLLAALVEAAGGTPRIGAPLPDQTHAVARALAESRAPLTLTTGGTGKGERDITGAALRAAGFSPVIHGLALRPGQRLTVATRKDPTRIAISLPGMPGALAPLFSVLVRPVLAKLAGDALPHPIWHGAHLAQEHSADRQRLPLLSAAEVTVRDGRLEVTPVRRGGNAWVLLPKGKGPLAAGTLLQVLIERI